MIFIFYNYILIYDFIFKMCFFIKYNKYKIVIFN